ncbi:MAG: ABC transporter ATP-binding protein [Gemmatimonadales bacterium]|nr:ABC transporter ATP-binding protein [Gemmatimonadales bacterium]
MLGLLRNLAPYLRRHRRVFLLGLAMVLVSNVATTLSPRFLQQAIDGLGAGGGRAAVLAPLGWMVAVAALGGWCRYLMRLHLNGGSREVELDLRNALFAHLLRLSPAFYDRSPTGDLMARTTNDLLAVRMVAGPALMYLVDTVVRAALVIPAMLAVSPPLTGLALIPLLGLPVAMVTLGQRIHHRSLAIQDHFGEITRHVHEHLAGVRVVRAYRQEEAETRRFEALNEEYVRRNLALARAQGAFHPILTMLGGLGGTVVLGVGGALVVEGRISVGALIAFSVYLGLLVWPMIALGWAVNLFQRGQAAFVRIRAILDEQPAITDPAAPSALPPHTGARRVTFEHVWFRYPNAADRGWVLQDVSFDVPAGQSLAVVGATGAGKSTLVELLVRSYDPDRGRILLDGVDIRQLPLAELRAAVGVVPQETFLFSEPLRANVLLGSPDDGRLEAIAETSQLAEALPALPQGWDTLLGERGINLSGGQKQRAAIARALAKAPPVFALDDALSAVDAHTEARILRALRGALAGRTSLVVSHRMAAAREAAQVLVLEEGRVVEAGPPDALLAAGGRFASLARQQALEEEVEAV